MRIIIVLALLFGTPLAAQIGPPRWRLTETLRIGAVDGPRALSRVGSVTVSPDGKSVYVAQNDAREVWFFDATSGSLRGKIGRLGGGPGEFNEISQMGWKGDSLWVSDNTALRISFFLPSGRFVRSERMNAPLQPETNRFAYPIGLTVANFSVGEPRFGSAEVAAGKVTIAPYVLIGAQGQIVQTLATLDPRSTQGEAKLGSYSAYFPQPMSIGVYIAVDPGGSSIAMARQPTGDAESGSFEITRLGPDGRTIYARSYRYPTRPVARRTADSLIATQAKTFEMAARPGIAAEAAKRYMKVPELHPPVSGLVVSRNGSVWIRREQTGGPTETWTVLDPAGNIRANVVASAGLKVFYVDENTAWGTVKDDLDVPYVVRYQIQR